jgi:two-component system C4-dicarboxylate transport sensor histidine kinase DctB
VPSTPPPSQSPPSVASERLERPNALAAAHARFARAALVIYLATAAVSVALLLVALLTDRAHDEDQTREQLLLETDVRAHSLGQRLDLLVSELRRLSQRSEVDLRDQDLAPEKSLLRLSHERSTFFNVGVAILDKKGEVVWSEPAAFLSSGVSFAGEKWFGSVRRSRVFSVVPVQPDRPDSILYVVSPLVKNQEFTGALLGAVDLARGAPLSAASNADLVIATHDGTVVYPPSPPAFARLPTWRGIFAKIPAEPFREEVILEGVARIVAVSPVAGTDLLFMSVGRKDALFAAARARLRTRLLAGLSLALLPAVLLVLLLQRSLKLFRKSEEDAVREERLRLLGEAANSIAHEVKNALNGLSMGLDLVVRTYATTPATAAAAAGLPARTGPPSGRAGDRSPAERRERIVSELRREIQRLSEFTTELMTFSRGVELRRIKVDLADFVPKVTGLLRDAAEENGAELDLVEPDGPVWVEVDAALLHAVISNLAGNALDAATAGSPTPRVEVRLGAEDGTARLTVSDNGKGVSSSMRPRLFEPFQSEKPNGVGIGLALSRKIARAHGGEITLAEARGSRPGFPGATFLLTLPLTTADEEDED